MGLVFIFGVTLCLYGRRKKGSESTFPYSPGFKLLYLEINMDWVVVLVERMVIKRNFRVTNFLQVMFGQKVTMCISVETKCFRDIVGFFISVNPFF